MSGSAGAVANAGAGACVCAGATSAANVSAANVGRMGPRLVVLRSTSVVVWAGGLS